MESFSSLADIWMFEGKRSQTCLNMVRAELEVTTDKCNICNANARLFVL